MATLPAIHVTIDQPEVTRWVVTPLISGGCRIHVDGGFVTLPDGSAADSLDLDSLESAMTYIGGITSQMVSEAY